MKSFAHELQIHLGLPEEEDGKFRSMPIYSVDEFRRSYELYKIIVETFSVLPEVDEQMLFTGNISRTNKKLNITRFAQIIAKKHLTVLPAITIIPPSADGTNKEEKEGEYE